MKNKLKKTIIILISSVMLVFGTSCSAEQKSYNKYSYEFFGTFDTVIQIAGYAQSQKEFDEYSSYAYKRFNELHKLFDNYNTYEGINNIKTINDNAGETPVEVDGTIIDLLEFCIDSYNNVSQQTDISMGALLNVWHNYREEGLDNPDAAKVPSSDELLEANKYTGINNITINQKDNTVYLNQGTRLDVGAVAKGYATEIIANELYDMGFESFFISSGGNVKAVGTKFDEQKSLWSIGIQNPYYFDDSQNNESLIDIANIENMSVVTSGDYQRFYTVDGTKYHHLIDPVTLYPAANFRSVTIFTQDSALADFLSTAVFTSSYEDGYSLIESIKETEAYWIFSDGSIKSTEGAKNLLKNLGGATN